MMALTDYLKRKPLESLTEELSVGIVRHSTLPLAILNYHQIDSPKTHPVARECRGTVVNTETGELVARSFTRFFNWGEHAEEMAKFDWSDFSCETKLDGCFLYKTALNLWGGGTVYIGDVVTKKLTPTLIGMDESGKLVPCKVVDWFDNGTKDNWMEIEIDCYVSPGVASGGHTNRLRVTTNHHIHLNGEFRPAIEAKPGDRMIGHQYQPSQSVVHLIKSSLLGDGNISPNGSSWKFTEGHKQGHISYVHHITRWLGECAVRERNRTSGYGSAMIDASTSPYELIGKLREEWYIGGEKQPPMDLSWMDDFSVAKWHMDDGCLHHTEYQNDRACLSTHGFSRDSVARLANKLREMYGVDAVISNYGKGWYIRINSGKNGEINAYWSAIAPHVTPCMRYKIPERYRDVPYIQYPWGVEEIVPVEARVVSVRKVEFDPENPKKVFPFGRKGFDIATTTKNYFAKGVLVHNSLVILFHFDGRWYANTRNSFGMGNMQGHDLTWREGICKALKIDDLDELGGVLDRDLTYVCELCSPWNKIVRYYPKPRLHLLTMFNGEAELPAGSIHDNLSLGIFTRNAPWAIGSACQAAEQIRWLEEYDPTFEGFVVRDRNNLRFKMKTATYLGFHRTWANGGLARDKDLLPFILNNDAGELLATFPEVKDALYDLENRVSDLWCSVEERWRAAKGIADRKEFAIAVKDNPMSSVLFRCRDMGGGYAELGRLFRESPDRILKAISA